jgi:LysW-gamma-L-lysine carboxypeptidase
MITPNELLINMLRIYSPSNEEHEIRTYIYQLLKEEFKVDKIHIDNAGNVIGIYEGDEPTILLSSHMDTVPGILPVQIDNTKIYGRGASDAKGPLASFLYSSYLVKKIENLPSRIIMVATVDEEGDGKGIKELTNTLRILKINPAYAIFGEPGGAHVITIGYKGRIQLRIKIFTESYHASSLNAPNAIESMAHLLIMLKNYELKLRTANSFTSITITPTIIKGGHAANVTPKNCEVVLDIRVPPTKPINQFLSDIINILKSFNNSVKSEYVVEDLTEPYQSNMATSLVKAFRKAILQEINTEPKFIRKSGTGEMNIFAHEYKIPIITYGPGDPRVSHTDNEYISIEDYHRSINVLKRALWILSSAPF